MIRYYDILTTSCYHNINMYFPPLPMTACSPRPAAKHVILLAEVLTQGLEAPQTITITNTHRRKRLTLYNKQFTSKTIQITTAGFGGPRLLILGATARPRIAAPAGEKSRTGFTYCNIISTTYVSEIC